MRSNQIDLEALFERAEKREELGEFEEAARCLLKAARLGHSSSQLNLGNCYSEGRGVNRSSRSAAYWYKKAYERGNPDGAFNLAIDKKNAGRVRDSAEWFKKAAEMGHGDAFIELAKIYMDQRTGDKVAVDLLTKALSVKDISDGSREEAAALLADAVLLRQRRTGKH